MTTTTLDTGRAPVKTDLPATYSMERMRRSARRWRYLTNAGAALIGALLIAWTLIPLYNMVMVSLEHEGEVFSDHLWPPQASTDSFRVVLTESHWYLESFWHQFGNSVFLAAMVTLLVLVIGTVRLIGSNANNAFSSVANSLSQ